MSWGLKSLLENYPFFPRVSIIRVCLPVSGTAPERQGKRESEKKGVKIVLYNLHASIPGDKLR